MSGQGRPGGRQQGSPGERPNGGMPQKRPGGGPGHGPGIGQPTEKAKDFKGTLKRLAKYLEPKKWSLMVVFVFGIFSSVFGIVTPMILGMGTDSIFDSIKNRMSGNGSGAIDYTYIVKIIGMLAIFYLVSALFNYLMNYLMADVAQKTVYVLRNEISDKFTRLPLKYYDDRTHGEILSRVTNDMENVASTLQQSLMQLITSIIAIVGTLIMMFIISPWLTIIALVTIPISIMVTKVVASKSQKYFKAQQKTLGGLNGHIEEMLTGKKEVKAFGYEEKSMEIFDESNEALYEVSWKAQFISGIIMPAMNFINNLGYVFIAVIGGVMITRGMLSVGKIQAFFQYNKQFGRPIVQTASIANVLQSTLASAERIFEVFDENEEKTDLHIEVNREEPVGSVAFEHVEFGYSEDCILMKDMNIDVTPGQTVAIVGPTGAGKTTLVNLLMRFYEIGNGRILVDGKDITHLKRSDLREMFGMVLQDTWLFKGTIRDNIAYGKSDATEEAIIAAAKAAHADHFIRTLPDGYDTVLNEDADNISQGQKQLLTIARVILANPSILILDEATSSVDTRTEVQIQKAMDKLMEGRTSFVIAHRLSTIKEADVILVMNEGDIIEAGNHQSLLEDDGFYAELYNAQFTLHEEVAS